MDTNLGWTSLFNIFITLMSISLSWWALQSFRFDLFLTNPRGARAKSLQMIIAVGVGYQLSRFFIDYLNWSVLLKYLS